MQGQLPSNYAALRVTEILYTAAFWQRSAAAPGWITMIVSSDILVITSVMSVVNFPDLLPFLNH